METLTSNTIGFVNALVKEIVLPIVVDYVGQHDNPRAITRQELEEVLQLNNSKYNLTKKSAAVETDYNKKCIWIFKRGDHIGDYCGKPVVSGKNYCSSCIKRSVFTPKTKKTIQNSSHSIIFEDIPKSSENDNHDIDLEPYDEANKLFINRANNFIFRCIDEKNANVIGKADNIKDLIHKLTQEDILKAQDLKYSIDEQYLNDY
jgi:hypothetical protein